MARLQVWLAVAALAAGTVPSDELVVNLPITMLNSYFQGMAVGEVLYPTDLGPAGVPVQLYRSNHASLRVIVFTDDVTKTTTRRVHSETYRWIEAVPSLVSTACPNPTTTYPPKPIPFTCENAIDLGTYIVQSVIAMPLVDLTDASGYPDTAACLLQKFSTLIDTVSYTCLESVLLDYEIATAMLKQKKKLLIAQGYTCGSDGRCVKPLAASKPLATQIGFAREDKSLANAYLEDFGGL